MLRTIDCTSSESPPLGEVGALQDFGMLFGNCRHSSKNRISRSRNVEMTDLKKRNSPYKSSWESTLSPFIMVQRETSKDKHHTNNNTRWQRDKK
jgi:hypothetical protein